MERFWSQSIFKYLRVEPEDHYFLLTEPVAISQFCFLCVIVLLLGSTTNSRFCNGSP
jgi:actin-related protein 3